MMSNLFWSSWTSLPTNLIIIPSVLCWTSWFIPQRRLQQAVKLLEDFSQGKIDPSTTNKQASYMHLWFQVTDTQPHWMYHLHTRAQALTQVQRNLGGHSSGFHGSVVDFWVAGCGSYTVVFITNCQRLCLLSIGAVLSSLWEMSACDLCPVRSLYCTAPCTVTLFLLPGWDFHDYKETLFMMLKIETPYVGLLCV